MNTLKTYRRIDAAHLDEPLKNWQHGASFLDIVLQILFNVEVKAHFNRVKNQLTMVMSKMATRVLHVFHEKIKSDYSSSLFPWAQLSHFFWRNQKKQELQNEISQVWLVGARKIYHFLDLPPYLLQIGR